jgi:hypothetical protein
MSAPGAGRACPHCGSTAIRRSRRHGFVDALCSLWTRLPYRCRECNVRFRRLSHPGRTVDQPQRTENRRRRRAIQRRELLLYSFALAAFAFVVLFVTADRS